MKEKHTILRGITRVFFASALATFLFPTNLIAQGPGLTPEHISKIETVSGNSISSDGKYIAYTLSKPADPLKENEAANSHLYLYNVNAKKSTLYFNTASVSSVKFRPEHSSITFLSKDADNKKNVLYEMATDGGAATELYSFDRSISSYSWHPNGKQLAFSSFEKAEESSSKLPYKPQVFEENTPNRKAYVIDLEKPSSEVVQINVEGSVYMLEWSPNGKSLAVSASPSPEVDDYYMAQKVMIVDPSSGKLSAEVENKGKIGQMLWSPSGDMLAIKAGADINDPTDGRILIVSSKGGEPKIIDKDFKGKYEHLEWVEKDKIHFSASEGTSSLIGSIHPDGSNKKVIFKSDDHVIRGFSRANNGLIAFSANTPSHPTELFSLMDQKNAKVSRLTFNNEWLNDVKLGKQEVITYKSRDSKYDIHGILIYPLDYKEGNSYPTITVVHGGPESHYGNGWLTAYSMPGQMAAAKGYLVFYPNYRGSTGRGIDFAYSSQRDMSGKEFDDIVDGVDHLIKEGITDKKRVGVTGGSYGGYASAWMSTYYSERFAAAVMFVGISNNLSKWGSSDIPNELFYVHSRERMWESDELWMNYLKRSPIYHVDKAQTPLLIMHGANDPRVHPAQSLELYRHIKVRKPEVPVRLVLYPGEGHGNRKSTAQYDYALRMLRWFDTYLMSGERSAEIPSWDLPLEEEKL